MHRHPSAWQVKRPLLACGLIAVAVTAVALKATPAVTLACVVPLSILLFWKRLRLCAVIALCFLVVAVGYRHRYVLPAAAADGQTDTLHGQVVGISSYGRMFTVRITESAHLPQGSRVMLLCPDEESLCVGDTFTAQVDLQAVADNQQYYMAHGAFVCAFPDDEEGSLQVETHAVQSVGPLQRLRTTLVGVARTTLPTRESGVLAALCFGEAGYIHQNDHAAYRSSGLSHLLVVSGLHLSMVALALRRLFRRFGMFPCSVLTLCATWLFALFVGATPSVLRAAMMLSLWLVGQMLFCRSDGLNALGLAAVILLAVSPCTVWDVGFQLSFAATLGVLLLAPRLTLPPTEPNADLPWFKRLWQTTYRAAVAVVAVSCAALLFTLPIACYHYGGFPLLSLAANLLASPVAGAAMLSGWLGAVFGLVPFLGWLSNGLLLTAGLLVRYMTAVAHRLSPVWAWVTVSRLWQWLLLTAVCALIVGGILFRRCWRRVGVVVLTLAVLTAGVGLPFVDAPIRLTIVPSDNEAGFILQQGGHCALVVTSAWEIDEVTYDAPNFTPDVLLVLEGDTAAITQVTRWPRATVLVATPTDWTDGTDLTFTPYRVGDVVTLWQDCRITRLSDGWIRLQVGGRSVCIGTDLSQPCPDPNEWPIYVGGVPTTPPDTSYTVVCNRTWLRHHHPTLTGWETILYDEVVTFTPLRGEWRRSLWL